MAVAFTIAIEPEFVLLTLTGELTEQDLRGFAAAADEIEGARDPVPHRITDMTGVTDFKIAYPDVQALAKHRRMRIFPNAFKSAIVVAGPTQFGMARMFQTLNDNPQIKIEIFNDHASALAWIRNESLGEGHG
jgi:hypothetical protein